MTTTPADQALTELQAALGPKGCLSREALTGIGQISDASGHATDGAPLALLRPASVGEVSQALEICHRHQLPVVPQGGLTGLSGGANVGSGQVALSMARFAGIEQIDTTAATMTVRAGTVLETAQRAAEEAGFVLPIDLGARGSCQIGGVISTNAGGCRVIRYGTTRDNLLGLEAVTAQGEVLSHLSRVTKDNTGYDLRHLFCGAEGTLGVVTRAVLRLWPRPARGETALCALDRFDQVVALLQRARKGLVLQAFEVMWRDHFMMSGGGNLFADAPPLAVLIEAEGDGLPALLETAFEAGEVTDALIAQSEADAQAFWAVRETRNARDSLHDVLNLDVSLPISAMAGFVEECGAAIRALDPTADVYFFGHLGDGNLHVMARMPALGAEGETALQAAAYPLVRDREGSISAEHGIGTIKRDWLGLSRSEFEIAAMRGLKTVFDPQGQMNPGKLLPNP
ncbi:FAD-binding oxidoreductase [Roseovarius sp. PS-C2]|uniref:FAD-binding oxidoreductase n=1 Tax=Roseovarius sp. PS-C2 TaxID=2820814 RepID=UPI001C0E4762|nr:FAD-binding oxidoreductase [Roseovarius sp. PS-C2]MBU3261909.1 FAD-binding oxidoreductase [Roseovarius sp. PS-C2]